MGKQVTAKAAGGGHRWFVASLGAVTAASIGLAVWQYTQAANAPAERAARLVKEAARTRDYASVERAMQDGSIDPHVLRQAIRTEFQQQMLSRVDGFFHQKDARARDRYLDTVIEEMENLRAWSRGRDAARPTTPQAEWQAELVAWVMAQPPDQKARIAEFRAALDRRRAARGLPPTLQAPEALRSIFGGPGAVR